MTSDEEDDELQILVELLRSGPSPDEGDFYRRALEQFDRVVVRRAMNRSGGNLTRAANLLGLSRVTLRSKLRSIRGGDNHKDPAPREEEKSCC